MVQAVLRLEMLTVFLRHLHCTLRRISNLEEKNDTAQDRLPTM